VALAHIEDNPQQFPVVRRDKRRALLKRFPYGLYFRLESTSAVVVGCFFTGTEIQGRGNLAI